MPEIRDSSDDSVQVDAANTWTAIQTYEDQKLKLFNPAKDFNYVFVTAAIGADRNVNWPLLTGDITLGDRAVPLQYSVSDETTVLSTGTKKTTFRIPFKMTVTAIRASLSTAGTGAALVTVDVNDDGSTMLSTKITIDATEKTSQTAATASVLSPNPFLIVDDSEMTVDIDTIDTDNVAKGLKITFIGYRTP